MAEFQDVPLTVDPVPESKNRKNTERKNIICHIAATFFFKLGFECFVGSYQALASNRYDTESGGKITFSRVGLLAGLFQACQCVGAIVIGPLIQRQPARLVLCCTTLFFALIVAILLIIDAATGGHIKPKNWNATHASNDFSYYGNFPTDCMIPIVAFCGMSFGMIDQTRRVVPRDIVGGDLTKLLRLDAWVHIIYEVAGTAGAWLTGLAMIPALGNNMSFILTPICMAIGSTCWFCMDNLGFVKKTDDKYKDKTGLAYYAFTIAHSFWLFIDSFWTGAKIIFSSRNFFWLIPSYSLGLYAHRSLENCLSPILARRRLHESEWANIMVGGSNLGELIGAGLVAVSANAVRTPMPWLRADALLMLVLWYLPYWNPEPGKVGQAWIVAATFVPISFGFAASDVSTSAHIQAQLAHTEDKDVSQLSAVLSFVYTIYICVYAIATPLIGKYADSVPISDFKRAMFNIAGVQFTIIAGIVFLGTFLPHGSWAWNPKVAEDEPENVIDAANNSPDHPRGLSITDKEGAVYLEDKTMTNGTPPDSARGV